MSQYYGAKLLFQAIDEQGLVRLAEESVRLVLSTSLAEAVLEARRIGETHAKEVNTSPTHCAGDLVIWRLYNVLDVYEMDEDDLVHSGEVYSLILSPEEDALLRFLYDGGVKDS